MSKATSNYDRIRDLGLKQLEHLKLVNFFRTYATAKHHWNQLEAVCKKTDRQHVDGYGGGSGGSGGSGPRYDRYDIFGAWPYSYLPAIELRRCLHQWGATVECMIAHDDERQMARVGQYLEGVARMDAVVLKKKGETYGDSWKNRGGIGAFMMLARKWDRIENIFEAQSAAVVSGRSVTDILRDNPGDVQDDVADLRRYLLLCEDEVIARRTELGVVAVDSSEPGPGYVNQDPDLPMSSSHETQYLDRK